MFLILHGQGFFLFPAAFFLGFGTLLFWVLMKTPPANRRGLVYATILVLDVAFALLGVWSLLKLL